MSRFTNHFAISPSPDKRGWWVNKELLIYSVGSEDSIMKIQVPAGYEFDGASVPYIFGSIIQKVESDTIVSACIHDYIYTDMREIGRVGADIIFLESLMVYNIPKLIRKERYLLAFVMIIKYILMTTVLLLFSWFVRYKIDKKITHFIGL